MIITYHNVEVKRCLAPFDTIAIVENNMHKEKEKREKHESGRTKKKTDGAFVNPPFYCDYGYNIFCGDDFFANHNCVMLDGAKITFGEHVYIAPNCCFATAGHPLDAGQRAAGLEFAREIRVGNNVWFGAGVTVLPGVTIGDNTVIGAGSIVNKDIPANVVAAGNPCRVLREITEQDRQFWEERGNGFLPREGEK